MSAITSSVSTISLSQLLQSLRTQQDTDTQTVQAADDGTSSNKKNKAPQAEATGYGPPQMDSAALFQLLGLSQTAINASQGTDTGAGQDTAKDSLKQLASAIKSGDLDAAKAAYNDLQKSLKASGVDTTATNNPFAKLLNQLGSDLDSNDIGAAQDDLASIQPPPPPVSGPPQAEGADSFASDIGSLFSAIKSGNLDDAKAAYAKLEADKPADAPSGGPFGQLLDKIGSALDSGDITGAQKALASVPAARGHGGGGGTGGSSADGSTETVTYNPDGTITVTTTDQDGNKTTQVEGTPDNADDNVKKTTTSATSDQWQSLLKELQQMLSNNFASVTSNELPVTG